VKRAKQKTTSYAVGGIEVSLNRFAVRLASLGAVWQQGFIPQEQTTHWTGGHD